MLHGQSRVRGIDLETDGDGKQDVCEIGWQDVSVRPDGKPCPNGDRISSIQAAYLGRHDGHSSHTRPGRRPCAVLEGNRANRLRPSCGVDALATHRAAFEQRYCTPNLSGGARWICTWKCALRLWPHLPRFSNQMVRYQRRPEGLVHELGLPAHRQCLMRMSPHTTCATC